MGKRGGVERRIQILNKVAEAAASGGGVEATVEEKAEISSFWIMLSDVEFLKFILNGDPLARSRVEIVLDEVARRTDKPNLIEAEKIVLIVERNDDGEPTFTIGGLLGLNTASKEFVRGYKYMTDCEQVEAWAKEAYRDTEYEVIDVEDMIPGVLISLSRHLLEEDIVKSHPSRIRAWLLAIEEFLEIKDKK